MSTEEQQAERAEVRRPKFDGTINLGHVLTATSMLIGGLLVWTQSMVVQAKQDVRIQFMEKAIADQQSTLRSMAETQSIALRNQDSISYKVDGVLRTLQKTQ